MIAMPSHLTSTCGNDHCTTCAEPVKQAEAGGWFITIGHAGFNSAANNRSGYKTRAAAIAAYEKYRGRKLYWSDQLGWVSIPKD